MRGLFIGSPFVCLLALLSASPASAGKIVTLYLDGAIVEQEARAQKGYLEIFLPPGSRADSLRIRPQAGSSIVRVATSQSPPSKKTERELAQILEREELLNDRMKALAGREEIFKAAARAQSAKAPRKTKTNIDPMKGVMQGTDYAISQLEAVYAARRRVEKEIELLAGKRGRLTTGGQGGGNVAKVWLDSPSGVVVVSFLQPDRNWIPSYELRASSDGKAALSIFPREVSVFNGETVRLVLAALGNRSDPRDFVHQDRAFQVIELESAGKVSTGAVWSPLALVLTNTSSVVLPPGKLACYLDGQYFGAGNFPGLDAGKSMDFVCRDQ